jgi:hypothetical protein
LTRPEPFALTGPVATGFALVVYSAGRRALRQRRGRRLAGPALVLLSLVMLVPYAKASAGVIQPAGDTDDRAGVAFVREQFRPGDIVFMTANTHRGLSWCAPGIAPSVTYCPLLVHFGQKAPASRPR